MGFNGARAPSHRISNCNTNRLLWLHTLSLHSKKKENQGREEEEKEKKEEEDEEEKEALTTKHKIIRFYHWQ